MNSTRSDFKAAHTLRGKRVVFVFGSLELGGSERQGLILARHLSERERARVEVWGFNRSGPVAAMCEEYGLAWRVIPFSFAGGRWRRLAALAKLARTLRAARTDILLPYTLLPNVVCGLVWKLTGASLCVWNQRDEGIERMSAGWERRAVRQTPMFISNSRRGARFLTDTLKAAPAKVCVINNGVEWRAPEASRAAWRERLRLDEECFVACMVANLHQNKDHKTLLTAWRGVLTALETSGRGAVLVLAGRRDDAYESLVKLSDELKITRSVHFLGHVSDVAGLLGAVDVSVFSSRSEGCPNGVLESMAAGLAVAGTDTGGIKEALGPACAPFLATAGDAAALAEIILKLAGDPALRAGVGAANRERAGSEFDRLRMCEETAALLVNSLSRKAR